ncbi:MAG: hypothetical protein J3K34DRAFT_379633 [Monoraphidium minutum]|nr:MAG: hypothetical protein J3K34DRAFT_379633 [Monoraphidium minutum]
MAMLRKSSAISGRGLCASGTRPACPRPTAARAGLRPDAPLAPLAGEGALSRRAALAAAPLAAAAAAGLARAPDAAAEAACGELIDTPSGLKFCEITEGTGKEPAKGSLIRCHYTGRLASNGKVFDSSYTRGRPLSFKVGAREVIRGWDLGILGDEGIPPMKEGGKRLLVIPADLGYGERGAGGGLIPPGATLEFEVELLGKR